MAHVVEALGVAIGAILDNGREYCGRPDQHLFELLPAMDGIRHPMTQNRSRRTIGFGERMNRTLLDECFRLAGHAPWYLDPAEIHRDLDASWRTTSAATSSGLPAR
jgi:hypothetical protein